MKSPTSPALGKLTNLFKAIVKPNAIVVSTRVNEQLRSLKLLDSFNSSCFDHFAQGRHLLLKLLLLTVCLLQFPLQLFHLLIECADGLLVLPLFVHQSGIVLPNTADEPFLCNTTILKGLDANQGLKKAQASTK